MKKNILLGLLIFFSLACQADEVEEIGRQAAAFFAANDYEKAASLYNQLNNRSLPDWQKAIVLYNLGTVKLTQSQFNEAITHFQRVPPKAISFPSLLISLKMNQGLLFLREAASPIYPDLNRQQYLLELGLNFLKEAEQLECQIQHLEGLPSCLPSDQLTFLLPNSRQQVDVLKQKQYEQNLVNGPPSVEFVVQQKAIQSMQQLSKQMASSDFPVDLKASYSNYLDEWKKRLTDLPDSDQIAKTHFQPFEIQLAQFLIRLEAFVNDISNFQSLKQEWENLKTTIPDADQAASISHYLTLSEEQRNHQHPYLSQLFLTQAIVLIEEILTPKQSNPEPKQVLKQAIRQAQRALQFQQLALLNDASSAEAAVNSLLKDQQAKTLTAASLFIPSILKFEKTNFNDKQQCQDTPWDQAVPLFEKGYSSAQQAEQALRQSSLALTQQEQTLVNWQPVLPLLDQTASSHSTLTQPSSTSSQEIQHVLNLIQDMQAEDIPAQPKGPKEMHAW